MVRTRAQSPGASRTREVFRSLDLPPELRVRIYEHLLGGQSIHVRNERYPILDIDSPIAKRRFQTKISDRRT